MSAFVSADKWVIWELPNGSIGEGTEAAYRDARDTLPEEDRSLINAVWTPAEMGALKRAVVTDAMFRISGEIGGAGAAGAMNLALHQGAYQIALMRHNIGRWAGPKFQDGNGGLVPCTEANIDRLDTFDPLVVQVVQSIGRRNPLGGQRREGAPDPKRSASAGASASPAAAASLSAANSIPQ